MVAPRTFGTGSSGLAKLPCRYPSLAQPARPAPKRAIMPSTSTTLRIPLAAALRHPGNARPVVASVELDGLAGVAAEIEAGTPVAIDLLLERVPEGIVVRGNLTATWSSACSRCLEPVGGEISVHVDELFETSPVLGETYPIEGHELGLDQLVRDALLLELPLAPQCTSPCAPALIGDVDTEDSSALDPRWAVLSELEI